MEEVIDLTCTYQMDQDMYFGAYKSSEVHHCGKHKWLSFTRIFQFSVRIFTTFSTYIGTKVNMPLVVVYVAIAYTN